MIPLLLLLLCAVLLLHAYAGYPASLWLLGFARRRVAPSRFSPNDELPKVSIVFSVYNEAAVLAEKLENCLALDYPADRREVVAASDASDDGS
ncbi:MAG: glycosyltransferase family 2 protein, partial [Candidatus Sumerlaeota bacterium]|nr:glycosyltransferase family 2 protein [Candidatus Sumerlaeota bacterium]